MKTKRNSIVKEFALFIRRNKAYWLIPVLLVYLLLMLSVFFGGSAIAPFVYSLF